MRPPFPSRFPVPASAALLAAACGGASPAPPVPADLAALDPLVAEAVEAALGALERTPQDPAAWAELAMVYHANQLDHLAIEAYDEALARGEDTARNQYRRALVLFGVGREDEALRGLERALELSPQASVPRWRLGEVRLERGELAAAKQAFELATRRNDSFHQAWLGLARVHLLRDEPEQALGALQRVLEDAPRHRHANALLASALRLAGRAEPEDFRFGATTFEPKVHDPWEDEVLERRAESRLARAIRLIVRERPDRAAALLETELAEGRRDITVYGNLAEAYEALGRTADARAALEEALRLAPRNVRFHADLSVLLAEEERFEEALGVLGRALAFAPERAELHLLRWRVLARLGRSEEALAALRRSLELDGRDPRRWVRLANAELAHGDADRAVQAFEEAAAFAPAPPDVLVGLAQALLVAGRLDEAQTALTQAAAHPRADAERIDELGRRLARAVATEEG